MADAGSLGTLTIAEEDPRFGDAGILVDEMDALVRKIYPEDEEDGVVRAMPDDFVSKGVFVVARLDGAAVGCGGLLDHPPVGDAAAMEVKCMYVRPEARGRRTAEQVLRWLEIMARAKGAGKLVLQCGPRQPDALRLYERCGYSRRSAYGKHADHPLSIFFEKRL